VKPRKKKRSTIKEVAELAGVAKTTVSHAISGKRPVAPDTRERIFAAMRELRFTPNPVARRLAGSPSHAIALVFPLASSTLAAVEMRFLTSIGEVVNRSDYTYLTLTSPRVGVDELRQIACSGLVDGVILMRIQVNDERVQFLKEAGMPFVMIGRPLDPDGLPYVDLDGEAAIELAVNHLVELGHTEIAFICPDDSEFGFAFRLLKGYSKSCRRYHLNRVTTPAGWSDDAGYHAMQELLSAHPKLSGVIVWSDVVAVGAISALRDAGREIPRDISLISFDRSDLLHLAVSDLTIVDTRPETVGAQAARLLLAMLADELPTQNQVLMPPRLMTGKSTARRTRTFKRQAAAKLVRAN
jgi:DNA-binding LacI/PurR family transcriptional regulator